MTNRARNLMFLTIVAVGTMLRSHDLLRPWIGVHNAWGGAMYGNIARNFVKYGYWATEFGPVSNGGLVSPDRFEFYYHYPPLLVWLVSASFHMFGVHEWSARLVPLMFSTGLMGLIYLVARQLFSERLALLAMAISAILPIEAYYGSHVDVYGSIVVFFTTLALLGYARWLVSSHRRDLVLCILGVVLGCMTAWYTFFLVPLIIGHHRFVHAQHEKPRDREVWLIALSALAVFVLFLLHRRLLMASGRTEVHGTLIEKLILRMGTRASDGQQTTLMSLVARQARDFYHLYTIPVVILTAAWAGFVLKDAVNRRVQGGDWLILILLGYGFLHNAAFPSFLLGHDFMIVCYVPGIALAATGACDRLARTIGHQWGRTVQVAAMSTIALVVLASALVSTKRLHDSDSEYAGSLKRWGDTIRSTSAETDVVLVCSKEDRIFQYYADRDMIFSVDSKDKFDSSLERTSAALFVCQARQTKEHRGVVEYVRIARDRRDLDSLVLVGLRR